MTPNEQALFESFLRSASSYVEFGTGGSTVLAARAVRQWLIALDSSVEWLEKVRVACEREGAAVTPTLVPVDIGPIGDWGRPMDDSARERWPLYHESIWTLPGSTESGLYMVDGRFRVACFAQILLRCRPGAIVLIHDFQGRPHYHVVHELAREVARSGALSAFVVGPDLDRARVREVLAGHRHDWR